MFDPNIPLSGSSSSTPQDISCETERSLRLPSKGRQKTQASCPPSHFEHESHNNSTPEQLLISLVAALGSPQPHPAMGKRQMHNARLWRVVHVITRYFYYLGPHQASSLIREIGIAITPFPYRDRQPIDHGVSVPVVFPLPTSLVI